MSTTLHLPLAHYLSQLVLPQKHSHKGENGKLLIIGGSELFHAASAWSLEVASRMVDMVFYSSVPENNALIQEAKKQFWNGVVVPRGEVDAYIKEADCVLIGPGMTRDEHTQTLVNTLLRTYPTKKWVIDAGALQMADPSLFTPSMIITPHHQEFERVFGKQELSAEQLKIASKTHQNVTIVLKGETDTVVSGETIEQISGGNQGMTKGGTGDVLAGLIAGFYCLNEPFTSAVLGSLCNKQAGEDLFEQSGLFFNSSDLVAQLPKTMKRVLQNV